MKTFLARWLITMVTILLIAYILPGVIWVSGIGAAIIAALSLGLVNAILRPIVIILTLPLTFLTFGLFLLVINGLMLALVAWLVPGFYVGGLGGAIIASLLISLVSWILSRLLIP
jgi:putative membrane protein